MILSHVKPPELRDVLTSSTPSEATLDLLMRRRSLTVKDFTAPGPCPDQLTQILTIAARVPDHKKQVPWRFIIIEGPARARIGEVIKSQFLKQEPEASDACITFEAERFLRAPLIIAVVSTADPKNEKVPEWEQILTSGAVCQNILIAVNAMGFAAQWLTEWYAYDPAVLYAMGLKKTERIAGFVYIGSANKEPAERGRPHLPDLITKL